ncbi:MAG: 50S ribosomal protein L17 [Deltaproteobacteria bacterium CG11_big_fil_rev_8_21_14_0_20_45_16]|nr:MAG: 50S ribosomal protein L17 [Deltaproteobacteria bacterium CG11_big_fil_rev_8_21_14_0_20_45_16]
MRHQISYRKLSRQRHHYKALMRNLAQALFEHERIQTTLPKAKEMRRFVEKIITLGKRGGLHNRRLASALMANQVMHFEDKKVDILTKVFGELAKRYENRSGGYTRIYRLARERAGDAADMALIELVDAPEAKIFKTTEPVEEKTKATKTKKSKATKSEPKEAASA